MAKSSRENGENTVYLRRIGSLLGSLAASHCASQFPDMNHHVNMNSRTSKGLDPLNTGELMTGEVAH